MIYGHEKKVSTFKNLADKEKLSHSYLFHGPDGVGKFLFARSLANYLENGNFCAEDDSLLDSLIIETEDNSIGLGDLEDNKEFFLKKPFKSSTRLVIIDEAHKLTVHAQSSLLKFVEESPNHTIFVFVSKDPKALLVPLQSRLTNIYFSRLSLKTVKDFLINEKGLKSEKAEKIAKQSFGRIGRAINITKENKKEDDNIEEFLESKILKIYLDDKISNASKLKKLLQKEREIKRYNTNPKLQKKSIKSII
ncbi:MAG: AAA family ATPase [Candidatus Magasanikbacteria bacterium]